MRLIQAAFTHDNPKFQQLKRLNLSTWKTPSRISTWTEQRRSFSVPRGGLTKVRKILQDAGHMVAHRDLRELGDPDHGAAMPEYRGTLRGYQERAVYGLLKHQQGLLRSSVGSGKTEILIALAACAKVPSLIVVPSGGLFDQWLARAMKSYGVVERDIGIIRGSDRRLRPFTIAMQQTLASRGVDPELNTYFGLVAEDETHKAAAASCYAVVDQFKAKYRFGVSDDERRKDGLEPLIYDLFGEVACEIGDEELVDGGHVLDVQVRVVPTSFRADWYGLPERIDPSDFSGTAVVEKEIDVARLHAEMAADPRRNELAVRLVLDEVAKGERVIVFSHLREHCFVLYREFVMRGIPSGFFLGGQEHRKEFRETRDRMVSGDCRVGVGTYQALGTGIDLPSVAVGVAVTPIAANRAFLRQVRGRLCRTSEGKSDPRMYYLLDSAVFPTHSKNLARWFGASVVVLDAGVWSPVREWIDRAR